MELERIRCKELSDRVMSARDAVGLIKSGETVAFSGFTPSGYPKAVPLALAERASYDELAINVVAGASVGPEIDTALVESGVMSRRYPYQTDPTLRNAINDGSVLYADMHLSHTPGYLQNGFLGKLSTAVIEAVAIRENGGIIPSTSVGIAPTAVHTAENVIVEINTTQPLELEGIHDIYLPKLPPNREPIPIKHPADRIGTGWIPCAPEKIKAVVFCDKEDQVRPLAAPDSVSEQISGYIIDFLESEKKAGRLPDNLLPLQSGVGSVANAVLSGLVASDFRGLTCYTEVIQDAMLDLIDCGKVRAASGSSFTPSEQGLVRLKSNIGHYKKRCVLRPMEISNNPEVIRRLGVIAMNTAIEVDIYGNVNSTHLAGSRVMNGIGGSGDFTRNGLISIYTTPSTAKNCTISSIVPFVSHVDHTEHEVMVIVTEQGIADLRGLCPTERAESIINNCAHPAYKGMLRDYYKRAKAGKYKHTPHLIGQALSWHDRFLKSGTMQEL